MPVAGALYERTLSAIPAMWSAPAPALAELPAIGSVTAFPALGVIAPKEAFGCDAVCARVRRC
jgi:hypothetical protein